MNLIPTQMILHRQTRSLEIYFSNGEQFILSCEYLRVFSPSAEVRGHGTTEGKLQYGKKQVAIKEIEPVGSYAVKFIFDDGHQSGIYSWATLYDLATHYETNWQQYLQRLAAAGQRRE